MISTPNRLQGLVQLVESGASPQEVYNELERIITLQPLDLAIAGRQQVEQAIAEREKNRADYDQFLKE